MGMSEKEVEEKISNSKVNWLDKCIAIKSAGEQKMRQFEDKFLEMMFNETNIEVCKDLATALVKMCGADDVVLRNSFGLMLEETNVATRCGGITGLSLTDASPYLGKLMKIIDSDKNLRVRLTAVMAIRTLKSVSNEELLLHELERISGKPDTPSALRDAINETVVKIKKDAEKNNSNFSDKSIKDIFGSGEEAIRSVQRIKQKLPNKRS
ncbi:MAG: hypothetical protein QW590_03260 [Candidatus Bilamarchaeaceae archaeon]